jgi:TfoX/Sxy family transcriptional regulator of competence genes
VAYDETLGDRVRGVLGDRADLDERRMFGGLAFLLAGNMCCGVLGDDLLVRLPPAQAEELLESEPGARPFDATGRPMRGWLFVSQEAVAEDPDLERWVGRAEEFASSLPPK